MDLLDFWSLGWAEVYPLLPRPFHAFHDYNINISPDISVSLQKCPLLQADVYVAPPIPWSKPDGRKGGPWSPISCTLIHGRSEAVLVDTPITTTQTQQLIDWVKTRIPTKKLITIYITHGHGDHFFGIPLLLQAFPGVQAVATVATVAHMKEQLDPKTFRRWTTQFPNQIYTPQTLAQPLPVGNTILLESHIIQAIEVGQADTHDSTVLWVPTLKLAVCGDVVYGDVHQMLGEVNTREKRAQWIASVRKVEALEPALVVPGHKQPHEMDGPFHLAATRRYIEVFEELLDSGITDPRALSAAMLERYPTRFNPGALVMGCIAACQNLGSNL
ncbi:Metallo-hydrolase/oxidoreductase [Penicillium riverlandense]|uniref:Metallo-hydrolase/oxidoreductase n=1 Tax=Penicillium riverlandense TaxID=1903569 RepID=UPI00254906D1|nr:Metallo-hydrolase/oxidoreductase [Penicillium riverlandense]KAJ5812363.1 Metallo-hydrolase/oxidoreductase [Penicillium riverlandense]